MAPRNFESDAIIPQKRVFSLPSIHKEFTFQAHWQLRAYYFQETLGGFVEYIDHDMRRFSWLSKFGVKAKHLGVHFLLILAALLTSFAADNSTPTTSILSLKVIDSQEVDCGDYSIFFNLVETPILKPQPAPIPVLPALTIPSLTAAGLEAIKKAEARTQVTICGDATVYDGKTTILRWWQDGGEYVYRSSIQFNYLSRLNFFETEKASYFLILAVAEGGSLPTDYAKSSLAQNGDASTFVLISQPKSGVKPEAAQFMRDIHTYYDAHKTELITAYQESEKARIAKEQWDKDHPPQRQNIVIQYFPIKSSMPSLTGGNSK